MDSLLPVATLSYVAGIFALALFAKNRVKNATDFLAAGRRLSTAFASTTLFATWFGAGTLLTATDAIYEQGLSITALEPFGAGFCLVLAGGFVARPLWRMKILTVPDLFGIKFGKRAEIIAASLLAPGYLGWIAVQITALAGIINIFFGISLVSAMVAVTILATTLACLGGMWSVTLTDFFQMILVVVVICLLGYVVIDALGFGDLSAGLSQLLATARIEEEIVAHTENPQRLFTYLNVFAIASLGNLPGQDLAQRIFSAKSETVARRSCFIAGACYLVFGSISILLGLAARTLLPEPVRHSVIPHLAMQVLTPGQTILLVLAIISIIMSTMDSAMLATSSIVAHNLIRPRLPKHISLVLACRVCIIVVGALSLMLALWGKSAYMLLEQSYAVSFAGLFAPFALGLYLKNGHEKAAIVSMLVGMLIWILGFFSDHMLLSELAAVFASFLSYAITLVAMRGYAALKRQRVPI